MPDGTHDPIPYYSPSDLKESDATWRDNPILALRDYGPKIFLEIGEGDVITIPTSRGEYLYNWSSDGTFYFFEIVCAAIFCFAVLVDAIQYFTAVFNKDLAEELAAKF